LGSVGDDKGAREYAQHISQIGITIPQAKSWERDETVHETKVLNFSYLGLGLELMVPLLPRYFLQNLRKAKPEQAKQGWEIHAWDTRMV
jgi:nucleoside-specific outer membrane channel protein Tsx